MAHARKYEDADCGLRGCNNFAQDKGFADYRKLSEILGRRAGVEGVEAVVHDIDAGCPTTARPYSSSGGDGRAEHGQMPNLARDPLTAIAVARVRMHHTRLRERANSFFARKPRGTGWRRLLSGRPPWHPSFRQQCATHIIIHQAEHSTVRLLQATCLASSLPKCEQEPRTPLCTHHTIMLPCRRSRRQGNTFFTS